MHTIWETIQRRKKDLWQIKKLKTNMPNHNQQQQWLTKSWHVTKKYKCSGDKHVKFSTLEYQSEEKYEFV